MTFALPHLFSFISGDFHPTAPIKSKSEHRDKPAIVHLIVKFMFVQIKSVYSERASTLSSGNKSCQQSGVITEREIQKNGCIFKTVMVGYFTIA